MIEMDALFVMPLVPAGGFLAWKACSAVRRTVASCGHRLQADWIGLG